MSAPPLCCACRCADCPYYMEKHGFRFYRCDRCGLVFCWPPLDAPPEDIYGAGYFYGAKAGYGYVHYEMDKSAMSPVFRGFLKNMERTLAGKGRLLDVGAATGYFVELAAKAGWDAAGIELSADTVAIARKNGVNVVQGTLADLDAPRGSLDAITLWDVIEHLPHPEADVERAATLLRTGGLLAILTPDVGSPWAKLWGRKWHAINPPEHIVMFNEDALTYLLNEKGFDVVDAWRPLKRFSPPYFFNVLSYWTGLPLPDAFKRWLETSAVRRLTVPAPLYDNLFLLARKR